MAEKFGFESSQNSGSKFKTLHMSYAHITKSQPDCQISRSSYRFHLQRSSPPRRAEREAILPPVFKVILVATFHQLLKTCFFLWSPAGVPVSFLLVGEEKIQVEFKSRTSMYE